MLLFAGITLLFLNVISSKIVIKYSNQMKLFTKVTVTKLLKRSQSAGHFILNLDESISETLRNKSVINIKKISVHVPIHFKPQSKIDFGHYLAGLIDGDGHFSNTPQLVIVFNELDASLAYYIKSEIGYGNIYKVKNKKAIILVISKKLGIIKVLDLINGKIRSNNKFYQINKNILTNPKFKTFSNFNFNSDLNLNNHWLAGFADADASFQIKLINRNNKTEVRLNFQIDQKKNDLLILIKNYLGGNIGYSNNQDTFEYNSSSLGSAYKIIKYFNKYHLNSHKHIDYLK
jgi:hypothetical protein